MTEPITIVNRYTRAIIYTAKTATTLAGAVLEAIQAKVSLANALLERLQMPSGSNLSGSDLSGSDLRWSNLSWSDLSGSDLRWSNLSRSDLSRSDLSRSDLSRSDLSGSDLSRSDLSWSNLSGSDLRGSDLSWSNLSRSDLSRSDLSWSNLSGSDLSRSDLSWSNLSGSDLRGSDGSEWTVVKDSRCAFAGPVGSAGRTVFGFLCARKQPKTEADKQPRLILRCGCFCGDRTEYIARVDANYKHDGRDNARWHRQCIVALDCIAETAATWGEDGYDTKPKCARKPTKTNKRTRKAVAK